MASILPDHARDWPLWARTVHGLIRVYCRLMFGLRADPSSVPASGPAILVANHHAGPDPLFLIATNRRIIAFLIAVEYYRVRSLTWILERVGCVPVDRRRVTAATLRGVRERLEAGRLVGIFPGGGIHAPGEPVRPKPGAALLALETGAPVVPVHPPSRALRRGWKGLGLTPAADRSRPACRATAMVPPISATESHRVAARQVSRGVSLRVSRGDAKRRCAVR